MGRSYYYKYIFLSVDKVSLSHRYDHATKIHFTILISRMKESKYMENQKKKKKDDKKKKKKSLNLSLMIHFHFVHLWSSLLVFVIITRSEGNRDGVWTIKQSLLKDDKN